MKIGAKVQFKSNSDVKLWRLTQETGTVLAYRGWGPIEKMVTARFGDTFVHVSEDALREVHDG